MADQFPKIDPATIAPLKDGKPDLYNYLPTRFITKAEAEFRGWSHFYIGDVCRYNHKAPRFVANPRLCVDCKRQRENRPLIGAKEMSTPSEYVAPVRRSYSQRKPDLEKVNAASRPLEPDRREKEFLLSYANVKVIDKACDESNMSLADFYSRMSYSEVFRNAVNQLEAQLGIKQTPPPPKEFEWTDEKRELFIRMYINTGDIQTARDSILVTPYDYYRELESNADFAKAVADAEPFANNVLEEVAVKLAIKGSDKLLVKVLAAKKPEAYRDSLKLDVTNRLVWDDSKERRLQQLLAKSTAIEVEFEPVDGSGESRTPPAIGAETKLPESESNLDLL